MGACCSKDKLGDSIQRNAAVDCTTLTASTFPIICLIGSPGSGKKTIGKRLAQKYGFKAIILPDLMRREAESGSERGEIMKKIMIEGRNLPADVIIQKVEEQMANAPDASGYVLVGFPRQKKQCYLFDKEVRHPNLCIYLWARKIVVEDRMKSRASDNGRFDDAEGIMTLRIKTFFHSVSGVVGCYKKITTYVDAEKSKEEVFDLACKAVDTMLAK